MHKDKGIKVNSTRNEKKKHQRCGRGVKEEAT
jgi:hypothetical protein